MISLIELLKNILLEEKSKRDRCLRIADRKFDKPSAYKSGAVVRCRQGSIWKGLKENQNININLEDAVEWDFSESDEVMFIYDIESLNIDPDNWDDERIKFSIPVQTIKNLLYNTLKNQETISLTAYGIEDENSNYITVLDKDTAYSIMDSYYENYPDELSFGLNEAQKETLRTWFKRKGTPGKKGGWVDCNAPIRKDGKITGYKACGREKGEKRSKYPSCRPTPAQCKTPGKGKKWGKTK